MSAELARVAGVVLAAGSSTRMGENKLLLELDGDSLVRRATRTALSAGLDPVLVVLGHDAERVGAEVGGLDCRTIVNAQHARGIRTSIKAGTAAVPGAAAALVLVLADMPFVTSAMIEALVAAYRARRARVVVSQYGAVEAPPTLYDRSLFAELLELSDEGCARRVIRDHRHEAEIVAWPEAALRDIDVASDYAAARAGSGSTP